MANTPEATKNTVPDVQTLFTWNDETMQIAERTYRSWLRGAETVQTQAMEFWNAELQKGIEAMSQIAQCQTAAEAFGVQTRYATEAMQGLIAEGQKVVQQLTSLSQAPWAGNALVPGGTKSGNGEAGNGDATAPRSSRRRS